MTRARLVAAAVLVALTPAAAAADGAPLAAATIVERLHAQLPLAAPLRDAQGRTRTLGEVLQDRPALLVLGYYHCSMLCGLVLEGTARALAELERDARGSVPGYAVVAVSIDPRDDPASALERQRGVLARVGWTAQRWPFLVGTADDVSALAAAAGFGYRYDAGTDQYAHAAALVVLAPGGRVSSYLYGVDFDPREIGAALRDAELGAVRSPLRRFLLRCFHYVPALRRHGDAIAWSLRATALATLCALAVWLVRLVRAAPRSAP